MWHTHTFSPESTRKIVINECAGRIARRCLCQHVPTAVSPHLRESSPCYVFTWDNTNATDETHMFHHARLTQTQSVGTKGNFNRNVHNLLPSTASTVVTAVFAINPTVSITALSFSIVQKTLRASVICRRLHRARTIHPPTVHPLLCQIFATVSQLSDRNHASTKSKDLLSFRVELSIKEQPVIQHHRTN